MIDLANIFRNFLCRKKKSININDFVFNIYNNNNNNNYYYYYMDGI